MPASRLSGTTFWLGTTAANGATDTYTQITGARQVGGSLGFSWQTQDSTAIEDSWRKTTKTVRDGGNMDLEYNEIPTDPGQVALQACANDTSDLEYNLEVRYAQGDKRRLKVKANSFEPQIGNAGAIRSIRVRLEIENSAVYVAA